MLLSICFIQIKSNNKLLDMNILATVAITLAVIAPLAAAYFYKQYQALRKKSESDKDELAAAVTQIALLEQDITHHQGKISDWERTKEESMRIAKAAMFESGTEVFKKEAKELNEHFNKVTQTVSTLHSQVNQHGQKVDTVWKSLSTPSAAGQFSEISLENTLKNYGLESGKDFFMQYSTNDSETGSNLRPDAVVILPQGNLLVIDSKASKFFLELAEAEGSEQEAAIKEKLKKRMREHINSLASKNYKDAVESMYKKAGQSGKIKQIFTSMFIQSEASLERLYQIDPEFRGRCEEKAIIPSGPTGLAGLLSLAKFEINNEKRNSESENIINDLGTLLGSMEIVLKHALGVGKGIASAAKSYNEFTKSVNANLLPKARKMVDKGIEIPKNKALPQNLPSYHVSTEEAPTIEGSSEAVTESKKLEEVS
jgi:DNA recombination protein RmuC